MAITANAQLIFHTKRGLRGNIEQLTYEWDGPKDGIIGVSGYIISEKAEECKLIGAIIEWGPYKLQIIEYDPCRDLTYLIRQDSYMGRLRAVIYHLSQWLDLAYRRLIITAAVWKLADYDIGKIPSWRDLHIIQKIRKSYAQAKHRLRQSTT